jgi:hypothetical protein
MKIGTKSVLFGAHCFFIHPIFVFIAWWRLYGFPFDPRLWVAFFVHDLGYWGKPNMDGKEGEAHVEFGAKVMHLLFDWKKVAGSPYYDLNTGKAINIYYNNWGNFSLYHSRFYAKKDNESPSKLCIADKLAICLEPTWFYLFRVSLTGEVMEYMKNVEDGKYLTMRIPTNSKKAWFEGVKSYLKRWVEEHKDGKQDTWTPVIKTAINENGVWK